MKKKLTIGMIGMGFISDVHLRAFAKRDDVIIKAISDNDHGNLLKKAKKHGIQYTYPDYRYMLKDEDIDVIDIMTPHSLHQQHVCDALLIGKTVICEKPITTTIKDLNTIIKTSKKTKKKVYIKQYLRHSLALEKFQEKIESGEIGTPYLAQCLFTGNGIDKYTNPYTWRGNRKKEGGGVFVDIAGHMIDRLGSIIDYPQSIYGQSNKVVAKLSQKGEDVATAVINFPKNMTASFTMSQTDPGFGFRWEVKIFGSKGVIIVTDDKGKNRKTVEIFRNNQLIYSYHEDDWWENSNIRAIHDILDRIQDNEEPLVKMESAAKVIKTIDSFYLSSNNKKIVNI